MNKYLNVDWLKRNHQVIHFFGLGFIQLKLNDHERLHFYHPSLGAFTEEPHDHRYDFISEVLKGSIRNDFWKIDCLRDEEEGESIEIRFESCKPNVKDTPKSYFGKRIYVGNTITNKGSSYYVDSNTFHQVKRIGEEPCITFVTRGKPTKDFARILVPIGSPNVCPFSRNLKEEKLWQLVEDCLNA